VVFRGQFLERPTLIPSGDVMLEGLSHRGRLKPGLLIVPPPLAEGGSMDSVIAAEVAFAAAQAGFPSLRFNYRGVGASQGIASGVAAEWLHDARQALVVARENQGTAPVAVAIGAADAIGLRLAAEEWLPGLIIINPTLVRPGDVASVTQIKIVVAANDQRLATPTEWVESLADRACVIPQADRQFTQGLPAVGKAVVEWLRSVRKTSSFSQAGAGN
jgi:alpha/beta superfamily hydrolase